MSRVLWKIPETWGVPGLAERTLLYPSLYLRRLGFRGRIVRHATAAMREEADAFVIVMHEALSQSDQDLVKSARERDRPLLVIPLGRTPHELLALGDVRLTVISPTDFGPGHSTAPRWGPPVVELQGCVARQAEDELLWGELRLGDPESGRPWPRDYVLFAGESDEALEEIGPAVRAAAKKARLAIVACAGPSSDAVSRMQLADVTVGAPSPDLVANARMVLCAFPKSPAASPLPGAWVRTALFHGAPVIAASHPSIDGLAHLCVIDDWARGFARLSSAAGAAAARAEVADLVRPESIATQWAKVIDQSLERPRPKAGYRRRRPVVMILFDLNQDVELLLPIAHALRERQAVELRLVVTDWLSAESQKTLDELAAARLPFELVARGAVRGGEAPELDNVAAMVTACDTSVGPHRAAHRLTKRAAAAGIPSFTLQHGFENVGLSYNDATHGEDIEFASDVIFLWGQRETLGDWVKESTSRRTVPVGASKKTAPPAMQVRVSDRPWRRTIGVFENLHWDRYDDDYRRGFLADLEAAADARPDTLFVVKPHHAGRWLSKNPDALREAPNLKVLDPTNPAWQPYTAPVLLASMDAVVTTPSTVAMDAVRAGRPVAVAAYGLDLALYAPLPVLGSLQGWLDFLDEPADASMWRNEAFLERVLLPGCANHRIAAAIEAAVISPERGL